MPRMPERENWDEPEMIGWEDTRDEGDNLERQCFPFGECRPHFGGGCFPFTSCRPRFDGVVGPIL